MCFRPAFPWHIVYGIEASAWNWNWNLKSNVISELAVDDVEVGHQREELEIREFDEYQD